MSESLGEIRRQVEVSQRRSMERRLEPTRHDWWLGVAKMAVIALFAVAGWAVLWLIWFVR